MQKRKLGKSGSLGHRTRLHGHELWLRSGRGTAKKEMILLIRTAVERGVTFFDILPQNTALSPTKNLWAKR